MNANEKMKIRFMGSSDGLALLESRRDLYLKKVLTCLDLKCYHPLFSKGCWGTGHVSYFDWSSTWSYCLGKLFQDMIMSLTPAARLWLLQHILVSCVLSPPTMIVQDMICQLQSYDERDLHVYSIQQATDLFELIHDMVGQLVTWSTVLLRSPKLAKEGRLGTPVSWPVHYDRRSSRTGFLKDNCQAMEPVRQLPKG